MEIIPKITNALLYITKYNINNKNNKLNQNFCQFIILMIYSNIFPIENFIFIINTIKTNFTTDFFEY